MTGSFPRPFLPYIRSEHNGFCTKTNENEFISRQAKCIQRLHPSLSPEVYIKFLLSYLLQLYQLGLRPPHATVVGWLRLRDASGTSLPLDWKETRPTTVHYRDKRIGDMSSSVVEKWWVFFIGMLRVGCMSRLPDNEVHEQFIGKTNTFIFTYKLNDKFLEIWFLYWNTCN